MTAVLTGGGAEASAAGDAAGDGPGLPTGDRPAPATRRPPAVEGDGSCGAGPRARDWAAAVAAITAVPRDAQVLLICHVNPDGDALGSMLACGLGLRRLGFTAVQATFPGPPQVPPPFAGLPGSELLVPATAATASPALVLTFDAASAGRLGELADRVAAAPTSVVLDHHASNTRFGGLHLVDPDAAATSVVVDELLRRLAVPLDREIAECLYVALVMDTGSFKYDVTTAKVHAFAARLVATGLPVGDIARRLFDSRPFGAARLFGEALCRAELEPEAAAGAGLVWTYATLDDLARHGQRPQVLEALIDAVRGVDEADVACVLKEARPGEWAVSLRSKGRVDVSRVAVALGGGGHRAAAGFTGRGDVAAVIGAVRAELGGRA